MQQSNVILGQGDIDAVLSTQPGDVVSGKYRVDRIVGFDAVGVVADAMHLELERPVALTFPLPARDERGPEVVRRFLERARSRARATAAARTSAFDSGRTRRGVPYVATERSEHEPLRGALSEVGRPPLAAAVDLALEACEVLAILHAAGIVHAGVSADTLEVARREGGGLALVVLAAPADASAETRSTAHDEASAARASSEPIESRGEWPSEIGPGPSALAVAAMAPERLLSPRDVDRRADLWSLGAVLYELLAGRPPFEGARLADLCANVLQAMPPSLRMVAPEVPAHLEAVVQRCLAKRREARFESAVDLAAALVPFASGPGRAAAERIEAHFGGPTARWIEPHATRTAPARRTDASRASEPAIPSTVGAAEGTTGSLPSNENRSPAGRASPWAAEPADDEDVLRCEQLLRRRSRASRALLTASALAGALLVVGGAAVIQLGPKKVGRLVSGLTTRASAIAPAAPAREGVDACGAAPCDDEANASSPPAAQPRAAEPHPPGRSAPAEPRAQPPASGSLESAAKSDGSKATEPTDPTAPGRAAAAERTADEAGEGAKPAPAPAWRARSARSWARSYADDRGSKPSAPRRRRARSAAAADSFARPPPPDPRARASEAPLVRVGEAAPPAAPKPEPSPYDDDADPYDSP